MRARPSRFIAFAVLSLLASRASATDSPLEPPAEVFEEPVVEVIEEPLIEEPIVEEEAATEPEPRETLDASAPREPASAPAFDHSHALWTKVLQEHMRADLFDYEALKLDSADHEAYLKKLQAVTPEELASWNKQQRFAFWINAYNAWTIKKVVDNYPIKSIKKLGGAFGLKSVFDNKFIPMTPHHPGGKKDKLSLNAIEHDILRARFKDARVHAAINCASFSCPPLRNEPFVADRLGVQLDAQMRAFVIDPKRNIFDTQKNRLRLSEVFKWFAEDFERDAGSVREYILRFAPKDKHDFIRKAKIKYIDYDWDLNDAKKKS